MAVFISIVVALFTLLIFAAISAAKKGQVQTDELQAAVRRVQGFAPNRVLVGSDSQAILAIDEESGQFALARRNSLSFVEMSEQLRQLRTEGRTKEENKEASQKILRNAATVEARSWRCDALMAVEIVEDGNSVTTTSRTSQLGGAIVGGLALGGVGLLAGALTGSKSTTGHVSRMELLIKVDDMSAPVHRIAVHIGQLNRVSAQYKEAREKAEKWATLLSILIRKADAQNRVAQPLRSQAVMASGSIADELKKLGDLVKDGLMSEDEFREQKAKLLAG